MAQGEFWVERQNWARWPRVLKVNHYTERGTETRRYLPERYEAAWNEREYAVGKIAELEAENAKLRELVLDMWEFFCVVPDEPHVFKEELDFSVEVWKRMRELGIEVTE